MKKKLEEKIQAPGPEKFFGRATTEYFSFHKHHFKDDDGYALSPDWNSGKGGMERRSLKFILQTLRQIAEGKYKEWTEERMVSDFNRFMEKSLNHSLVKKNFLCCMMNRFKFDILSSSYNPQLSKRILEVWYFEFPDYARDYEKDKAASEIIIGFLKQQYILNSVEFEEKSVLSSFRTIAQEIKGDDFWALKSLKSISNNLQEFVNRIKSRTNGRKKDFGNNRNGPTPTSDSKIRALKNWGLSTNPGDVESSKDL